MQGPEVTAAAAVTSISRALSPGVLPRLDEIYHSAFAFLFAFSFSFQKGKTSSLDVASESSECHQKSSGRPSNQQSRSRRRHCPSSSSAIMCQSPPFVAQERRRSSTTVVDELVADQRATCEQVVSPHAIRTRVFLRYHTCDASLEHHHVSHFSRQHSSRRYHLRFCRTRLRHHRHRRHLSP